MSEAYLVWSNEHGAWWRPNSQGYTKRVVNAGRYSREEAINIARDAHDGWREGSAPPEIAVAERDVLEMMPREPTQNGPITIQDALRVSLKRNQETGNG